VIAPLMILAEDFGLNGLLEAFADAIKGDALEQLIKEAVDNHQLRLGAGDTATGEVENELFFKSAKGRGVRTFHVVGFDLQAGYAVHAGITAEEEVTAGLEAVDFLHLGEGFNHALPQGARGIFGGALEQQVAGRQGSVVVLLGIQVKELVSIREEEAAHAAIRALAIQLDFDESFGEAAAHVADDPVQVGIAAYARALVTEFIGLAAPALERDVAQVGGVPDENFASADVGGLVGRLCVGVFYLDGSLSIFSDDGQGMTEVCAVLGVIDDDMERNFQRTARRHIDERAI